MISNSLSEIFGERGAVFEAFLNSGRALIEQEISEETRVPLEEVHSIVLDFLKKRVIRKSKEVGEVAFYKLNDSNELVQKMLVAGFAEPEIEQARKLDLSGVGIRERRFRSGPPRDYGNRPFEERGKKFPGKKRFGGEGRGFDRRGRGFVERSRDDRFGPGERRFGSEERGPEGRGRGFGERSQGSRFGPDRRRFGSEERGFNRRGWEGRDSGQRAGEGFGQRSGYGNRTPGGRYGNREPIREGRSFGGQGFDRRGSEGRGRGFGERRGFSEGNKSGYGERRTGGVGRGFGQRGWEGRESRGTGEGFGRRSRSPGPQWRSGKFRRRQ